MSNEMTSPVRKQLDTWKTSTKLMWPYYTLQIRWSEYSPHISVYAVTSTTRSWKGSSSPHEGRQTNATPRPSRNKDRQKSEQKGMRINNKTKLPASKHASKSKFTIPVLNLRWSLTQGIRNVRTFCQHAMSSKYIGNDLLYYWQKFLELLYEKFNRKYPLKVQAEMFIVTFNV